MITQVANKQAVLASYTDLMYRMHNATTVRVKILNEALITFPVIILTRKNYYLLRALNEKIENLKASGLIGFWYRNSLNSNLKVHIEERSESLSLEQLSGCFEILCVGTGIGVVFLILEFIFFRLNSRRQRQLKKIRCKLIK